MNLCSYFNLIVKGSLKVENKRVKIHLKFYSAPKELLNPKCLRFLDKAILNSKVFLFSRGRAESVIENERASASHLLAVLINN